MKEVFSSIKQIIFHRELSQVTTFTFYLYLRKGEHLFPISMYCCATNEFSSLFLSPKYLLTELEFKKKCQEKVFTAFNHNSKSTAQSWLGSSCFSTFPTNQWSHHPRALPVLGKAVLKLRFYSFSQFLPQPVEPNEISKGGALSQVLPREPLWKLQLVFAENGLTTVKFKGCNPTEKTQYCKAPYFKAVLYANFQCLCSVQGVC